MTYDPYNYLKSGLTPDTYNMVRMLNEYAPLMDETVFKREQKMNFFTAGISFMVNI